MLAKGKSGGPELTLSYSNPILEIWETPLQASLKRLPPVPAMPESLLLLQVLLSGPVTNLEAVAEAIRTDVGLTIGFFRHIVAQRNLNAERRACISENIVLAGIPALRLWAAQAQVLSTHRKGREALRACEQFWSHARLTALMSEESALKMSDVSSEEAYIAGLLFHMGELPSLLDWDIQESFEDDSRMTGASLAIEWSFPAEIIDIVQADENRCTHGSKELLRVVTAADRQAMQLQGLVARYARNVF